MAAPEERDSVVQEELGTIVQQYEDRERQASPVDDWEPVCEPVTAEAPVTLADLE